MIGNVLVLLLFMVVGYVIYQAGYKDGYDRGHNAFTWHDREDPEIYIDHDHGGDNN